MILTDEEFQHLDALNKKLQRAMRKNGKVWINDHLGAGTYEEMLTLRQFMLREHLKRNPDHHDP